jgi:hypothetical protein
MYESCQRLSAIYNAVQDTDTVPTNISNAWVLGI